MLIDEVMPSFDRTRIETLVVDAEPARVYSAIADADLLKSGQASPGMRFVMGVRTAPAALVRRIRRQPPPPDPEPLRPTELPEEGEWVKLGEDFGKEVVFGAIGRFWGRDIDWRRIKASEFREFEEPGYAKIAANLSVRSYGTGRSLLSYEARTLATDERARRGFLRYWRLVSPGVGIVLRGALRYIKSIGERP